MDHQNLQPLAGKGKQNQTRLLLKLIFEKLQIEKSTDFILAFAWRTRDFGNAWIALAYFSHGSHYGLFQSI